MIRKRAILALADGRCFDGCSFGAEGEAAGEVVFNTSMTGYQEILTDPSYEGQLVAMTYPQIGNVGINPEDVESHQPFRQRVHRKRIHGHAEQLARNRDAARVYAAARDRRHRGNRYPFTGASPARLRRASRRHHDHGPELLKKPLPRRKPLPGLRVAIWCAT